MKLKDSWTVLHWEEMVAYILRFLPQTLQNKIFISTKNLINSIISIKNIFAKNKSTYARKLRVFLYYFKKLLPLSYLGHISDSNCIDVNINQWKHLKELVLLPWHGTVYGSGDYHHKLCITNHGWKIHGCVNSPTQIWRQQNCANNNLPDILI